MGLLRRRVRCSRCARRTRRRRWPRCRSRSWRARRCPPWWRAPAPRSCTCCARACPRSACSSRSWPSRRCSRGRSSPATRSTRSRPTARSRRRGRAATADAGRTAPRDHRLMVLPGELFGSYRWGSTYTSVAPALTKREVLIREIERHAEPACRPAPGRGGRARPAGAPGARPARPAAAAHGRRAGDPGRRRQAPAQRGAGPGGAAAQPAGPGRLPAARRPPTGCGARSRPRPAGAAAGDGARPAPLRRAARRRPRDRARSTPPAGPPCSRATPTAWPTSPPCGSLGVDRALFYAGSLNAGPGRPAGARRRRAVLHRLQPAPPGHLQPPDRGHRPDADRQRAAGRGLAQLRPVPGYGARPGARSLSTRA